MATLKEILQKDDKGLTQEGLKGPSMLFRKMALALRIRDTKFDRMLDEYVSDVRSGVTDDKKGGKRQAKGYIKDKLADPVITWTFFKKVLHVLNPEEVTYVIRPKWSDKFEHAVEPPTEITYPGMGCGNELKRLFEMTRRQLRVGAGEWEEMVYRYISDLGELSPADESTHRNNIKTGILDSDTITWNLLLTAMHILGCDEFEFEIQFKMKQRRTVHVVSIDQDTKE